MDRTLAGRLNALNDQNDKLKEVEGMYLECEANKKSLLARLTEKAEGKSFAEREMKAYASQEWQDFSEGLAKLQTKYLYEKRSYDILDKAYLAEHLSAKLDSDTIKRQGA